MNNRRNGQIKYGGILSYLIIGINIIMGLIYTPWILRTVGSSSYGLYTLATSLIAIFLLDFGMSDAVSRFVARYRAENNQEAIDRFVGTSIKFYVVLCVLIAIVLSAVCLNIESIYANLTSDEVQSFKIIFIIASTFIVICFPVNVCNGVLNAYEEFLCLKIADLVNKITTVVVTVCALLLKGGIYELVLINGIFNLLTFIAKIVLVKDKTPVRAKLSHKNKNELREVISFTSWTTIQTMAKQMVFNLVPSILAMVSNTFSITLFGFASIIEGYVYSITQAINGLFLSTVARTTIEETNAEKVLPLMIKVGRINQMIVTLLIIGLTLLGKEFVYLWVGEEYYELFYCILALAYPYYLSASEQIADSSIIVLNKIKYSSLVYLFTGVLNFIATYFVAAKYSITGVCIATSICVLIRILMLNIVYNKVLRINILEFFKKCQIQMLPGVALSSVLSAIAIWLINTVCVSTTWADLIIKAIIVCMIYFVCMWRFTMNSFEKDIAYSFICKFRKK